MLFLSLFDDDYLDNMIKNIHELQHVDKPTTVTVKSTEETVEEIES